MKIKFHLIFFIIMLTFISCLRPASAAALSGRAIDQRANDTISELRSVTCENESLSDCQSQPSADLRTYVRDKAAAGWSEKQILVKVASTYGPAILLLPPKQGFNLVLWILPFGVVAVGFVLILIYLLVVIKRTEQPKRDSTQGNIPDIPDIYRQRLAEELKIRREL